MPVFETFSVRSLPSVQGNEPEEELMDIALSVSYLSASLQAMELSEPLRGVLRQMLLMTDLMARKLDSARPVVLMDTLNGVHRDASSLPSITRYSTRASVKMQSSRVSPVKTNLCNTEKKVLRCVGRGMSNAEIASELELKETTVATALSRAYAKLGARRRYHAFRLAEDAGLLA
jgi:DNA-binding NarL/FixJ family response regulator